MLGYSVRKKEEEIKVNQQGTVKKGPSETICIEYLDQINKKEFLNWFIGFVEGNENVFIVNRRYLRFELMFLLEMKRLYII